MQISSNSMKEKTKLGHQIDPISKVICDWHLKQFEKTKKKQTKQKNLA